MRLYALRRRYGLRWKTGLPPFGYRLWLDGLIFVVLFFAVIILVTYITENDDLIRRSEYDSERADKAERNLAHCLNGGSLFVKNGGHMIMCGKSFWVK